MYHFIYQICTLPKNNKFQVRKIVYNTNDYHSHDNYYFNYNQINNLLDNISNDQYVKIDLEYLDDIEIPKTIDKKLEIYSSNNQSIYSNTNNNIVSYP